MKSHNKSWLQIAEYASLASSAAGTVIAIASQQVAYAATPLTLALSLSVVNRQRFQQQAQLHVNRSDSKLYQAVQSLHQQIQSQPTERVDLTPVTQSLEQMEQRIQVLIGQLGIQQETQETQINALALRLDNLPQPLEPVDLSEIETEIISLQTQLQAIDPSSLNDSIALLQSHVDCISQQAKNLPLPFDSSELEQQLAQLEDSRNTYKENINCLASAITNLQSDTSIAEQARISQVDALILQLESISTSPEPHELSQLQAAITSLSFANASLSDRLDSLTQQFTIYSEPQLEQQILVQVGEIQRQLENIHAVTAEQHDRSQQLKNDLELQINQLRQETLGLNQHVQSPDETLKRLEEVEQLTDELEKRTTVLDEYGLSLVQVEQQVESLQLSIHKIDLDYLQQQLANESIKSADLESRLVELSEASATKQEVDALTQLVVEETERLNGALAKLNEVIANSPASIPQFDPSSLAAQITNLTERVDNLPLAGLQQQLIEVRETAEGLDDSLEKLHDRTRNLSVDQIQSQLKDLQRSLTGFVEVESLKDILGNLRQELLERVDLTVENQTIKLNQLFKEAQPNYKYELVLDRCGSRDVLLEALQKVEQRLILVCPWLTVKGADERVIERCRKLLSRGVQLDIGWGHLKDFDEGKLGTGFFYNALGNFQSLASEYPNQCNLKLLGTHEKFLVCDRSFAMLGSHNFLTSGNYSNERELGLLTSDFSIVENLIQRFDNAKNLAFS